MEKRIRFGCGFLFGAVLLGVGLTFYLIIAGEAWLPPWALALAGFGAVLFGLLGVRFGDELYVKTLQYLRWLGF